MISRSYLSAVVNKPVVLILTFAMRSERNKPKSLHASKCEGERMFVTKERDEKYMPPEIRNLSKK
jgi:hypothetical protein